MKIKQTSVTPLTIGVFVVVSLTGALIFFNVKSYGIKVVHEYLGMAFVLVATLHCIANFKACKRYFKGKFLGVILLSFFLSLGFVLGLKSPADGNKNALGKKELNLIEAKISTLKIAEISEIFKTSDKGLKTINSLEISDLTIEEALKTGQISKSEIYKNLLK